MNNMEHTGFSGVIPLSMILSQTNYNCSSIKAIWQSFQAQLRSKYTLNMFENATVWDGLRSVSPIDKYKLIWLL